MKRTSPVARTGVPDSFNPPRACPALNVTLAVSFTSRAVANSRGRLGWGDLRGRQGERAVLLSALPGGILHPTVRWRPEPQPQGPARRVTRNLDPHVLVEPPRPTLTLSQHRHVAESVMPRTSGPE